MHDGEILKAHSSRGGTGPLAGRLPRQQDTKTKQRSSPWPLQLLILLCLSLHLCRINQLDTLFLYPSKAEPCPNHQETLLQPWSWVSLMGTTRYFISFSSLFIKKLLKSKFWTSANWGYSKCIIKISLSQICFLPSSNDRWLLFPPPSVPSNISFHLFLCFIEKHRNKGKQLKFLWNGINLQQIYLFISTTCSAYLVSRPRVIEGHDMKSCSFPSVSSFRSRGGMLPTVHLGGLCHMHF